MKFCHVNIRSLLKLSSDGPRTDKLQLFLNDNDVDVCALSETHLDSKIDADLINIAGYNIFRKDRNRSGGGVCFYVRENLSVKCLSELSIDGIETLWMQINAGTKVAIFGVCYRPPNQSSTDIEFFMDALYATFDIINETHSNSPIVLLGDFNDRCSDWNSNHEDSELGLRLHDLLHSFGFVQLINEPTRGRNVLDLLITRNRKQILHYKVCDPIDNLDHCPIYGTLNMCIKKPSCYKRIVRQYTDENMMKLQDNLNVVPWRVLFNSELDCNELVDIYTKVVQDEIDNCMPPKEVLIRPRASS